MVDSFHRSRGSVHRAIQGMFSDPCNCLMAMIRRCCSAAALGRHKVSVLSLRGVCWPDSVDRWKRGRVGGRRMGGREVGRWSQEYLLLYRVGCACG